MKVSQGVPSSAERSRYSSAKKLLQKSRLPSPLPAQDEQPGRVAGSVIQM